jgi:hypothetical protein
MIEIFQFKNLETHRKDNYVIDKSLCDTPPYGHASTYQISLTYLERNNYLTLRSKVKVQTKVIMVPREPRGIEIGSSFSAEGYNSPEKRVN